VLSLGYITTPRYTCIIEYLHVSLIGLSGEKALNFEAALHDVSIDNDSSVVTMLFSFRTDLLLRM
jgi:hypothetical protein